MGNRTIGISFQLYSRNITRHKALHVSSMFNYKHANQNKPFLSEHQEKQTMHL